MPLVRSIRQFLGRLDHRLSHLDVDTSTLEIVPPRERYDELVAFVRSIDLPDADARQYLVDQGRVRPIAPPKLPSNHTTSNPRARVP